MLNHEPIIYIKNYDTGRVYSQEEYKRIVRINASVIIAHDFYTTEERGIAHPSYSNMIKIIESLEECIENFDFEGKEVLADELYWFIMNELEETCKIDSGEAEKTANFFITELRKNLLPY